MSDFAIQEQKNGMGWEPRITGQDCFRKSFHERQTMGDFGH